MLLLFAVSLQTFDLLLWLIKTIWQTAPIGFIKSSDQTDLPPFCLVRGGRQGIQQFITNSHGFRTPPSTKGKVQMGGFLQKNSNHRNDLCLISQYKKRKGVMLFFGICSYSFLSFLHWFTFTIIFLCSKQLKSFSPKSIYLQQNNGSY